MFILFVLLHFIICQQQDKLTYVHLVPHSHDDYGWLYTIDEYYSNRIIQFGWDYGNIRDILNSVYNEIQKNPQRKYIQVEIGFLSMWWDRQTEDVRQKYKDLVKNGQIEIINGGWTMHDEATTYFEDIIDQMTVGHQWVKDHLDVIPSIGWQIDPFGHQSTNAALFSQMGFNAQWFARVDYQDFEYRKSEKRLEMIWQPQEQCEENYIFSAVNYKHYDAPTNFYFERDEQVTPYNVQHKAQEFVNYFKQMQRSYRTNHLMHTMGQDFAFSKSEIWFNSIDNLIDYINSRKDQFGMEILYSTPSKYLEEINKQQNIWPVNNNDFFPYADNSNAYWTGYFTSRPALKGLTKDAGRYLQAVRNIISFENIQKRTNVLTVQFDFMYNQLEYYEQQMAALMHHDAVSGTERQHVANDYIKRVCEGQKKVRDFLHPLLQEYALQDIFESEIKYHECHWNVTSSECEITNSLISNNKPILISIFNPSVKRQMNIRIRIPQANVTILNDKNQFLKTDFICSNPENKTDCDLYFRDLFQGYSFQHYKIVFFNSNYHKNVQPLQIPEDKTQIKIELSSISNLKIDLQAKKFTYQTWETSQKYSDFQMQQYREYDFSLNYNLYYSSQDWGQSSGAYIFRPETQQSHTYSEIKNIVVYQGQLVTVVLLEGEHVTTQLRFYSANYDKVIEVETFVHPIQVQNTGKEIIMVLNTGLQNNKTFYTDSNGLDMQKRVLNFRPTWNLQLQQEVSGNYYPIGALISLKDINSDQQVSVVTDRSQGGTSLKEGQIEIMIHRRIVRDDARGVGESLNEVDQRNQGISQKIRHFIIFERQNEQLSRRIQNELDASPLIFFSQTKNQYFDYRSNSQNRNKIIENQNIYLRVYLRAYKNYYTLRLYNVNDISSAQFDIPQNYQILEELTLTANQSKKSWSEKQMKWTSNNGKVYQAQQDNFQKEIQEGKFILKPLQLRVFKLNIVST
ncbi:glycoside hydrolase family 38 amine-terminal domain protein (macronuclear) [Tetrahymena thermophila SB210]|uniref:Glycoside hydrolase family 38 amine-terminal domain protein n=1 Tax=Tetrahymena thermophila (strain SB210) TaxID=312017 RepID=I7MME7_TETTS|nr:glycoside hydrolase family 38 amine-terminal domain protein [Tetrahymena thermophila SB210]EAS04708.3 glycoside hydrolase family 38 amine-terminal domain protein [Tetrahymena thermophila SB210]|eukprot:XP_001024953.3 glycoside hydrolase family 38 amine-terminal domain protein [Tetrahymena thermophila SB210]